ncbi:MAG TPA: glycosyltransferase family 4 protein, partial [Gammaproteobacteria bacterium]|nr:glycosyltransferase family 4 protein [Gammaproteobacteria bacterium]
MSVSEAMKREIVDGLKVSERHVTVIPNGIEEGHFYPRDRGEMRAALRLGENLQIVLCVARLEPVKGVEILIRAFARLEGSHRRLVIVGDGIERERLQRTVERLEQSGRVSLVGEKPHDEIPLWINAADLVVLPSTNEGWPNVLMESFACGKPVVATRVGGVPEIVTSPSLGVLAEPGDPDDLARALEEALARNWDAEVIRARVRGRGWRVVA